LTAKKTSSGRPKLKTTLKQQQMTVKRTGLFQTRDRKDIPQYEKCLSLQKDYTE
jgi:hypothetical protein